MVQFWVGPAFWKEGKIDRVRSTGCKLTNLGKSVMLGLRSVLRSPPDAGLKPVKLPQNPEPKNGVTKLKPSPATEAPAHLGESRARDERSRHAQSRAYKQKRFSRASSKWQRNGVARGGDPPRHSVFFSSKRDASRSVLINVIYFTTWVQYHPLIWAQNPTQRTPHRTL